MYARFLNSDKLKNIKNFDIIFIEKKKSKTKWLVNPAYAKASRRDV